MKEITSLYIHFPYCQKICNYCDFYKRLVDDSGFTVFEQSLLRQSNLLPDFLGKYDAHLSDLKTLYLGGGTPSLWTQGPLFLNNLLDKLKCSFVEGGEFTLELNPELDDFTLLESWIQFGINRFSVGVQSCRDELLERIGRGHKFKDVKRTLQWLGEHHINFSVDLMLNLPSSTSRNLEWELEQILQFNPKHISVYIMKVGSNYPYFNMLADDEQVAKEYMFVAEYLQREGFEHYEVSNFAKPGFYSQHNMGYWSAQSVAAMGGAATGFLNMENEAIRYKWLVSRDELQVEKLNKEELLLEEIYLGLRTQDGVSMNLLARYIGEDKINFFIDYLRQSKFLRSSMDSISLNSAGFLAQDHVMDWLFRVM